MLRSGYCGDRLGKFGCQCAIDLHVPAILSAKHVQPLRIVTHCCPSVELRLSLHGSTAPRCLGSPRSIHPVSELSLGRIALRPFVPSQGEDRHGPKSSRIRGTYLPTDAARSVRAGTNSSDPTSCLTRQLHEDVDRNSKVSVAPVDTNKNGPI